MTRRDFQLIADVLADVGTGYTSVEHYRVAIVATFADRLEATNPRFDRYRFAEACKPSATRAPMR